jgi:hypothetical protein
MCPFLQCLDYHGIIFVHVPARLSALTQTDPHTLANLRLLRLPKPTATGFHTHLLDPRRCWRSVTARLFLVDTLVFGKPVRASSTAIWPAGEINRLIQGIARIKESV